ncbi:hypothetical protein ACIP4V_28315 [Streptomyces albidoflavus]
MNKTRIRRFGILTFTAITAMTLSMAPASALTDITIKDSAGRGKMTFHDDGDVFSVCDLKADGGAIVGKVWYKPVIGGEWTSIASEGDSSDAGCDKITSVDVEIAGNYQMRLYWNGAGYNKKIAQSRVFNE